MTSTLPLRLPLGVLAFSGGCALALQAGAEPIIFNPAFLHNGSAATKALESLQNSQALAPGRYPVRVLLNHEDLGMHELTFEQGERGELRPCLPLGWLQGLGFNRQVLADDNLADDVCLDLPARVPGAAVRLDSQALKLHLSLPQIAVRRDRLGYVDPTRWDAGIAAAFINYQATLARGSGRGTTQRSEDLLLSAGLNLGPWRLRSSQSLHNGADGRDWDRHYTYAQRDVPGLHANLTLGETQTGGEVFSSAPITGAVIATDLGMLPDSQQAYAPVIRGVALSRAKLEVRQNGYLLHTSYVSAGPFVIDDLSASGNGELEITLTEADGQVRRFTQAYATLGNLLREGVWRYEASLGRYRPAWDELERPPLAQGSLAWGLGHGVTAYGGLRTAPFYQAATLGAARDFGKFGALAADVTHAYSDAGDNDYQGSSYALRYGKYFATNTYLRFAGYRYSTQGYRDFGEVVRERSEGDRFAGNRRSRVEASINQRLGGGASLSASVSQDDYWGTRPARRQFQMNLSTRWRDLQLSLFASQSLTDYRSGPRHDRQLGLSASLPLGVGNWSRASLDATRSQGRWSERASVSGFAPEHALSYNAALSRSARGYSSGTLSMAYQGQQGSYSLGLNQGADYHSMNASATGSLVAHAGGITLGPLLGDTFALVEVPGIEGVGVRNAGAARTDSDGYLLAPYLRPYRVNTLELTTERLGAEVDIDNGARQVVPRRGAIVHAPFNARRVTRLVLTLHDSKGAPLPFGAQARNQHDEVLGIVGQGGQLLVATDQAPLTLNLAWGEGADGQCQVALDPALVPEQDGLRPLQAQCS